jgi:hypothetical protein
MKYSQIKTLHNSAKTILLAIEDWTNRNFLYHRTNENSFPRCISNKSFGAAKLEESILKVEALFLAE